MVIVIIEDIQCQLPGAQKTGDLPLQGKRLGKQGQDSHHDSPYCDPLGSLDLKSMHFI